MSSFCLVRCVANIDIESTFRSLSGTCWLNPAQAIRTTFITCVKIEGAILIRYSSSPTRELKIASAELRCSTSSTKCQMNRDATRSSPGRKRVASLSSISLNTGVNVASRSAV